MNTQTAVMVVKPTKADILYPIVINQYMVNMVNCYNNHPGVDKQITLDHHQQLKQKLLNMGNILSTPGCLHVYSRGTRQTDWL